MFLWAQEVYWHKLGDIWFRMLAALANCLNKRMAKFESYLCQPVQWIWNLSYSVAASKINFTCRACSEVTRHEPEVPQQVVEIDATPSEPHPTRKKQEPEPSWLLSYLLTEERSTQMKISMLNFHVYMRKEIISFLEEHLATYPNNASWLAITCPYQLLQGQ